MFCKVIASSSMRNVHLLGQCIYVSRLNFGLYHFKSTYASIESSYTCSDNILRAENVQPVLEKSLMFDELENSDLMRILRRFGMEGLKIDYLKKYNVKVSPDLSSLLFPFCSFEKSISVIQQRVFNEIDIKENITHSFMGHDEEALFGWSNVDPNDKELVVTSDPLDVIAINQSTGMPAVSLPFVDPLTYIFSPKLLSLLNNFKKVIFWMNQDFHSFKNHKLLALTLKERGFYVWSHECSNPLFCLQSGNDIEKILRKSLALQDERIKWIDQLQDAFINEIINADKVSGTKWKRFSPLNDLLKGHRRGELTVLSGHTGTGKTTFMSEYSLDLCLQGVPTLWVNLEIPNERLLKVMLCQFSRCSFKEKGSEKNLKFWTEKFKELEMCVLNVADRYSLDGLLSAMRKSISLCKAQHIIIDNLQFMLYFGNHNSSGFDFLRRQDQIFSAFREFATNWNCHITVVIHPRKEPEFSPLSVTSVSGTGKSTQEADNVIMLQTTKNKQYLEVLKNRYGGTKGCILLQYDENTHTFTMKKAVSKAKSAPEDSDEGS